jgi:hypothetical protein
MQEWHGAGKTSSGKIRSGTHEMTKGQGETVERPRMQQWHKGPRPKTAATRQNWNKGPRRQTAAIHGKKRATAIGIRGWSSRQLSPLGRRGLAYKLSRRPYSWNS